VFLVDGARTPFLKAGRGGPGPFRAADLAVAAGRPLLARQPFPPEALDEVILGCVMPGPEEANIARVTALRLGCGTQVPAWTVQRNCASGMQAIDSAAQRIAAGRSGLVLAGGVEAMSHAPLLLSTALARWLAGWWTARDWRARGRLLARLHPADLRPVVALLKGLTDPIAGLSMGQTAEVIAERFGIDRAAMDAYAAESHRRLAAAWETRAFDEEVEPLFATTGEVFTRDTGLRPETSAEMLASLPPAFDRSYGRVTAGNSAQISDGAAWLLLAGREAVERYGLRVLGRVVDGQWAALAPEQMGLGPVHAMAPLLARHKLTATNVDYWEINEAFAGQVLACRAAWESPDYCRTELGLDQPLGPIPPERLNVDGGGISLGHPVGASGARIVLHLLHVLRRRKARRGVASLCVGGGQGGALLIENADRR